jgi:uncharacterized membrane protein
MPFWKRLYNTVWLAFFTCALVPPWMGPSLGWPVHALLGLGLLALTTANARRLAALAVPPRLQRISRVTSRLALFQVVVGLAMGVVAHHAPGLPVVRPALIAIHVVCALAILAQSASVATGYDMWEEQEHQLVPRPTATGPAPRPDGRAALDRAAPSRAG